MIYPSVIGIGYLLPLEISFSLWFFFWAFKAQYVIISAFSIPIRPWTAASRQSIGAIIAVGCLIAWSAKDHLYRAVKGAFGFGSNKGEGELLSRRQAVGGYVGGAAGAALLLIWAGVLGLVGAGGHADLSAHLNRLNMDGGERRVDGRSGAVLSVRLDRPAVRVKGRSVGAACRYSRCLNIRSCAHGSSCRCRILRMGRASDRRWG